MKISAYNLIATKLRLYQRIKNSSEWLKWSNRLTSTKRREWRRKDRSEGRRWSEIVREKVRQTNRHWAGEGRRINVFLSADFDRFVSSRVILSRVGSVITNTKVHPPAPDLLSNVLWIFYFSSSVFCTYRLYK